MAASWSAIVEVWTLVMAAWTGPARASALSCRRGILAVAVLYAWAWMSPPVLVADQSAAGRSLEYDVKAAFLLNFTRFIQWPASESGADLPFTICILGEDPFGGALDQVVRGETVNGRKLTVQRNPATSIESCQLIYFGRYEKQKDILSSLHSGILSVGEGETFIREGGMIGFVLDNRRVRFLVNLRATQAAGLTVSSRLLAVAKAVEK